ncbi:hypothetical protein [Rhodoluna sp. KAS3]|uniref:hypothetical protein n=1 Tax=Rhodoluna sp. KAS3 TaxID=942880 RepID=UPI0022316D60|nr:hypothetical protein [Rhodoluna sp. KAS3]BDS48534.1 hypothetical protein RKAS3_01110 [Rhodoluna sp. KAS3]
MNIFASLISLVLVAFALQPASASEPVGIAVIDGIAGSNDSWMGFSYWKNETSKNSGAEPLGTYLCKKIGSANCKLASNRSFRADITAPVCRDSKSNCIESVAGLRGEVESRAVFVKYLAGSTVQPDARFGLPMGATASLWVIPDVPNSAGANTYIVSSHFSLRLEGSGVFETLDFRTSIVPVKVEELVGAEPSTKFNTKDRVTGENLVAGSAPPTGCYLAEKDICYGRVEFSPETRLQLSLVFDNSRLGSWFNGHLAKPDLAVSTKGSATTVTVSANPTIVQDLNISVGANSSAALTQQFRKNGLKPGFYGVQSTDIEAAVYLDAVREQTDDSATGQLSLWSFGSAGQGPFQKCFANKSNLLGMVSTNSLIYQGDPPQMKNGFLSYTVAGMHYQPDKSTVFKGQYSLIMRKSVARCLFNLSQVPITASVSVSGVSRKDVATEIVSSKGDWISLRADNFTFSKKTIKVKITKKIKPKK